MTSEGSVAIRLGWAAVFFLSLAVAGPALADRKASDSRPNQDSGPSIGAQRADGGSRASVSRPPSSGNHGSPSGRDHGSSGSGSASSGGDSRPPSVGPSGRIQVDHRRHGDSSGHGHHGHHYGRYYGHYGYGYYGYPYYYWPWWWGGWPYYGYPYGYGYGYGYGARYGYGYDGDSGAIDFDVSPEKAEVYVDGQRVGRADDFDGFPSFLWLPKGTYDVVIYLPGFETIARQYSVYPGVVIDVEDRMLRGESRRPEELVSKSTVNRDERLRRQREVEEEAERQERYDQERYDEDRYEDENGRGASPPEAYDARGEPGRLSLTLEPSDASIYLDGRFLGTAADLARLHSGLILDPGTHKLEVVRPGYESKTVEFEVEPGEEASISVELEEER